MTRLALILAALAAPAAALAEGMSCILMEAEPEYLTFLRQRFSQPSDFFAATGTDFFS